MMKLRALFLSVLGLLCLNFSQGQQFDVVDTLKVDNLEEASLKWVDLNQDFLYDLLVYGKQKDGPYTEIEIYLNLGTGSFEKQAVTFPQLIIDELQLKDYNRDNLMDIVFTGLLNGTDAVVSVLLGSDGFNYQLIATPLLSESVESFSMIDLNYDTHEDLLIGQRTTEDSLAFEIWQGTGSGLDKVDSELPVLKNGEFFIADLDSDGRSDLLLSGPTNSETITYAMRNLGNFEFGSFSQTHDFDLIQFQGLSIGEFGGDGYTDLFVSGADQNGQISNVLFTNNGANITSETLLPDHQVRSSLLADFDSDGKTDLWVEAEKNDSTFLFWFNDVAELSDATGVYRDALIATAFADWDLNGHLDYAELQTGDEGLEIVVFQSDLDGDNFGPHHPRPQVAVQIGRGQMKVSWQNSFDSLTVEGSLSYDALLMDLDTTALFAANMNTESFLPTVPFHGNQLYASELVVNDLEPGEYFYYVRSIDNAFNFIHSPNFGDCEGDGPCDDELELGKAVICDGEEVVEAVGLCEGSFQIFGTEGVIRNWYSDAQGALGTTDLLTYTAGGDDTLYGSVTEFSDCSEGQLVFNITTSPSDPSAIDIRPLTELCSPEAIMFTLSSEWTNVSWTSDVLGDLGVGNTLTFTPEVSDRVFVQAENPQGCTYQAMTFIELIDFQPAVADTVYEITVGQSVRLSASGGSTYRWLPEEHLSDPFSATPLASPRVTTDYSVIIEHEKGCSEMFTVRVNVEQMGGAANLFSPNGDNRNDQFYLQLSSIPATIDFRIYTRSGSLVYRETEGVKATSQGWDGTHKGEKLPPGVYYWRVQGTYSDGKPIILNAENSGKVHLIR